MPYPNSVALVKCGRDHLIAGPQVTPLKRSLSTREFIVRLVTPICNQESPWYDLATAFYNIHRTVQAAIQMLTENYGCNIDGHLEARISV